MKRRTGVARRQLPALLAAVFVVMLASVAHGSLPAIFRSLTSTGDKKPPAPTCAKQEQQKTDTKDENPANLLHDGALIYLNTEDLACAPNLYAYVRQNPWSHFDPEGLSVFNDALEQAGSETAESNGFLTRAWGWIKVTGLATWNAASFGSARGVANIEDKYGKVLEGEGLKQMGGQAIQTGKDAISTFFPEARLVKLLNRADNIKTGIDGLEAAANGDWDTVRNMATDYVEGKVTQKVLQAGAKRGPKTDPNAPHNAKIRSEAERLKSEGNTIIAGGGGKEGLVPTPGGVKEGRRPDVLYETPNGDKRGLNVGKTQADGTPIKREREALKDLNGAGGLPTDYVPYDK